MPSSWANRHTVVVPMQIHGPTSLPQIASSFIISSTLSPVLPTGYFIFRSRYLFAIGLVPIFSLGWNPPPVSSCTPKQLDSSFLGTQLKDSSTGLSPSLAHVSTSASSLFCVPQTGHNVFSHFSRRLFPLHSPLLSKSRLVSCPVRSYMLKFRTFSCLTWGVCSTWSVHSCASFSTHTLLSIRVLSIFLPGLFEFEID